MSAPLPWKNLSEMDRHFAASGRRSAARRERRGMRAAVSRLATIVAAGVAATAGVAFGAGELSQRLATGSADAAPRTAVAPAPATGRGAVACPVPPELLPTFRTVASRTGVPLSLLVAVAEAESGFDQNARSSAGAYGTMQVLPSTGDEVRANVHHPRANVLAGARYLRRMLHRFDGSVALALAAYHAGPTAVARHGGPPYAVTARYVADVQTRAAELGAACG